jgi:hypothetical protein
MCAAARLAMATSTLTSRKVCDQMTSMNVTNEYTHIFTSNRKTERGDKESSWPEANGGPPSQHLEGRVSPARRKLYGSAL